MQSGAVLLCFIFHHNHAPESARRPGTARAAAAGGVGVKHWTEWARPPSKDPIAVWAKKLKADARPLKKCFWMILRELFVHFVCLKILQEN